MTLSPLDSQLWMGLYNSPLAQVHLADKALLASMVRVEIALAHACEAYGMTPQGSGPAIESTLSGLKIDPARLSSAASRDGVPVPGLLALLRDKLDAETANALHWGATSQDIIDTATVLCLRDFADAVLGETNRLIDSIALLAGQEALTVQLARTRTQGAAPTTFGATLASWGAGLVEASETLASAANDLSNISLYGAAGTDAALGEMASEVRAHMANSLGVRADETPWHNLRDRIVVFGTAMASLAGQAGRIGGDLAFLASTGINEVKLAGGGSSAMPHKVNPIGAEAAQSLARFCAHLQGALAESALHGAQRDGVAWGLEWLSLRPLCGAGAAAINNIEQAFATLQPNHDAMLANLQAMGPAALSESLTYRLAKSMPRSDARKAVTEALKSGAPIETLQTNHPDLNWESSDDWLAAAGRAPAIAQSFARSRGYQL